MEIAAFDALLVAWLWPIPWLGLVLALLLVLFNLKRTAALAAAFGLATAVVQLLALVHLLISDDRPTSGTAWPTLLLLLVPALGLLAEVLWIRALRRREQNG